VLAALVEGGKPASETCSVFAPIPQLLKNVRYTGGAPLEESSVKKAIGAAEQRLGASGRLLIRKSGTEPLIRVMAESEDEALVAEVVDEVCAAIRAVANLVGTSQAAE